MLQGPLSMHMLIYIYTCTGVCIYVYTYIYTYAKYIRTFYVHICLCVCVTVHVHTRPSEALDVYLNPHNARMHTGLLQKIFSAARICAHTQIDANLFLCTRVYALANAAAANSI